MGDWNFLGGILEEVHIHSTMVGKIWLTILFIFRMLVLGVAAEDVWNDEQADFICNTEQPGCRNVCYDKAFPISLIRYWVLQVIFVSSPSLVYMGHALYRLRALEKERQRKKMALRRELEGVDMEMVEVRRKIERELRQIDQGKLNKAPLRGSLLRTYVAHIVTRSAVEVGFMTGQYVLYGFQLNPLYKCEREPCPNAVDCFVSRPTEKSVFMVFMQCIAAISLFLNILEIMHLGYKKLKKAILNFYPQFRDDIDDSYYPNKLKKDSVVHQTCIGTSTGHKDTIASAPSGYNLLLDKPPDGSGYPPLINPSSSFLPVQGDMPTKNGSDAPKYSQHSPTEHNSNSNNTSSDTRSPPCDSITPPKQEEGDDSAHIPPHNKELESKTSNSSSHPRDSSHTSSGVGKKPWKVSAPWNCSTVVEGNVSDSDSLEGAKASCPYATVRARTSSRSDPRRSRPTTPDSIEESSSESRHSPQRLSPSRRTSLASSASSRRAAPTDLQI
ncbi:gap junction alpha-9 protein-like [Xyrauchen texanus]|uniref:gap junction alpha-9 protein-like n=1 Tax=Xyrauchen texanus TaxID=154827 RepID=UPI00224193B3|nr:gap junction alpha-9 protein-like [Xyrauchen texanus]